MAFSGSGAGTTGDPYQITAYSQLKEMNDTLSASYLLMNDIDASDSRTENAISGSAGEYNGWTPIGSSASPFTGTFDGGGFKIIGLYINNSATGRYGLFGYWDAPASAAYLKNVTIEKAEIHGGNVSAWFGGILVGYISGDSNANTTIENVDVSGKIEMDTYGDPGGLAGYADLCTFTDCNSDITITNDPDGYEQNTEGGFCAQAVDVDFVRCTSTGSITLDFENYSATTNPSYGGFIGKTLTTACSFTDCSSSVSINPNFETSTKTFRFGGFIGYGSISTTFTTCKASGSIAVNGEATVVSVGGFMGGSIGTATECGATGDIFSNQSTGTFYGGGFEGSNAGVSLFVDCYAKGDVCADELNLLTANLGGFSGAHSTGAGTEFTRCYSTGEVNHGTSNGGGFLGGTANPDCSNCFWDTETSGWTTSRGATPTGKTTAEMKVSATFTGWDFTVPAVWYIPSSVQPETLQSNLTVWLSATGDYENFEAGTEDDSSFQVTLPSTNEIRWAESLKSLLVGTAADEWKIASNKLDTPLSPTNFGAKRQTNFGSKSIQAQVVNEVILFVDSVGRKIYEMTTGEMEGDYVSNDMTELSEQITESGVVCMAHQKNPDSILWCVLNDGSLISMVYDRKQNVIAWSTHPLGGNGICQSVCVVPGTDEDAVWISVERTLTGDTVTYDGETVTYEGETVTDYIGQVVYIEKMGSRILSALEDAFYVDCGGTYDGTATSTITGAGHLDGETVKILADGVIFDEQTIEDGSFDLTLDGTSTEASVVHYGLAYTSILKPMRLAVTDQEGTSSGTNTRVPELIVNFLNTLSAQYGNSESGLYDIDLADDRWEDEALIEGLFTGHVRVSMEGGISVENPILIATDEPGPMNIRSIVPVVEQTGR